MDKKIVVVSFLLAGLIALATMVACNKIQQPTEPEYGFITLDGERKRGWCNIRLEVPRCKSVDGVWYDVKQYESLFFRENLTREEIKQRYGTVRWENKE